MYAADLVHESESEDRLSLAHLVRLVEEHEARLDPHHKHLQAVQPVESSVQQPVVLDEGRGYSLLRFVFRFTTITRVGRRG